MYPVEVASLCFGRWERTAGLWQHSAVTLQQQWKHSHRHFIEDSLDFVANLNVFQLLCGLQLNSVLLDV